MSIPVYTVKSFLPATCIPQFLEHATGIHPSRRWELCTYVSCWRVTIPVCGLGALRWHFVCVSPYQYRDKTCEVLCNTCCSLSRGFVCIIYARGPITRHFTNIHTSIYTFAQILTPHCTIISLASCSAITPMPVITFPAAPWPRYFTCQRRSSIIKKKKHTLAYNA